MPLAIGMILAGLVLLTFAADRFVLAAARLSRLWGLSPLLVGALVVGMGTSAPELLVSTLAAWDGNLDLGIGNVVGSNVANVTLVLGACAVVRPLQGQPGVLQREGLLALIAALALLAALLDHRLVPLEALALLGGMVLAAALMVRWARRQERTGELRDAGDEDGEPAARPSIPREVTLGLLALAGTLLGAELLVHGASEIARALGLSQGFIGMTVVAVGTSLPELATAVAGARRNQHGLVLGNVLGSNLFNTLAVAGCAGLVAPGPVDPSFVDAASFMVLAAALAGLFAITAHRIVRVEGLALLAAFAWFLAFVRP